MSQAQRTKQIIKNLKR